MKNQLKKIIHCVLITLILQSQVLSVQAAQVKFDGSRFAPVPIEHAQGGRIGEQVYMKLHAVLKKDLSHVLLREGEQVTVEYRIAQKLSAPVKKGSCAGAIYYKLGGMVLREYQVETTEDMEKLDFEWCLRQVLKLAV